ncbi:MAG: UDP-N-acetylglucosamine 2-epimerase (non-hydrolyzing) [Nitrospirota bacterium]
MKILTVLGTRPEIIRLSLIIKKLDQLADHILVHTGQNYVETLSDIFFRELGIRAPNYSLGIKAASFGKQAGKILEEVEKIMVKERPDRLLILGDTNSGLSAVVAKRLQIPVYHMEAGNRCYDDRVPEEVNRRIIDHSSDILMPYTERSRANLIREGIPGERIYVIGNPIYEVIKHFDSKIQRSNILSELRIKPEKYFLATMHRQENVDVQDRLNNLTKALEMLHAEYKLPIIVSTHPRTQARMRELGLKQKNKQIRFLQPFGFFDFITLERNALCVLSDSGTVQEECAIFGISNVTIRDVTERPETLECGSNILSGANPENIRLCVKTVLHASRKWKAPGEYLIDNVSDTVTKIFVGYTLSLANFQGE